MHPKVFAMSDFLWFEGIPFPVLDHEKEIIGECHNKFGFRDEDTVILSYPKSGKDHHGK